MALKTQKTTTSVTKFIDTIDDTHKRNDSHELVKIFEMVTGEKATMWGTSIIGFGSYHYRYTSGQEGEWPLTGFSPRKQYISLYIMPGFSTYGTFLKNLGTFKQSKGSCLYIKSLSDIHIPTLKKLIKHPVSDMQKKYPSS